MFAVPSVSAMNPKNERILTEQQAAWRTAAARERRSQYRALLLLALFILIASIARAGLDRVFVHGWWRQW